MPSSSLPIEAPAGFAPIFAIGGDDGTGNLAVVSAAAPLPTVASVPAAPAALEGQTAVPVIAGPFAPAPLSPVYITLGGTWTGQVRLLRSTDGGATRRPVTLGGAGWGVFNGNVCEPVWQESESAAELFLEITPSSGLVEYRLAQ